MSIEALNNEKIYEVVLCELGESDLNFGKFNCKEYILGYSRVTDFDEKEKLAFCEDLGYWAKYENMNETDYDRIPDSIASIVFLTEHQKEKLEKLSISATGMEQYVNTLEEKVDAYIPKVDTRRMTLTKAFEAMYEECMSTLYVTVPFDYFVHRMIERLKNRIEE